MLTRTHVPRSDYENKSESIDNIKHMTRLEAFTEDEEIEEESENTFNDINEKYLVVEMHNKRLQEELKISNDEAIKLSADLSSKDKFCIK